MNVERISIADANDITVSVYIIIVHCSLFICVQIGPIYGYLHESHCSGQIILSAIGRNDRNNPTKNFS